MKRVLLDANVYEFIAKYLKKDRLKKYIQKQIFTIYGIDIIRKELRSIPKGRIGKSKGLKNIRVILLSLYDFLVGRHQYNITNEVTSLADKYYDVYKALGGFASKKEIVDDFKIVACASLHNLDIVVSEDKRTMLSETAINTYKSVNTLKKIRTPKFIYFDDFKELLRGVKLD